MVVEQHQASFLYWNNIQLAKGEWKDFSLNYFHSTPCVLLFIGISYICQRNSSHDFTKSVLDLNCNIVLIKYEWMVLYV